jgi:signal transduction histidine kinase
MNISTAFRRSGASAIASTKPLPFRRQLFWQLARIFALLIVLGIPLVLLTAPPPVDFVDLCLHRDAYRAALGQPQLQPSPCRIFMVKDGHPDGIPSGDFRQLPVGQTRLLRRFPRVFGLRWTAGPHREIWVESNLPRGYYQMSGSTLARLRVVLSFLLFYLLLLITSTQLVRRLRARLQTLRDLAGRLANGQLQAEMPAQSGDPAEFDHLRRRLLKMAETLKLRQQQEEEQRRQFEQAGVERNRRLAEVSHDLRTPLTSILGYAQLYREEGHGELEVIEKEGQALLQRVGQWLESCRLESAVLDVRLVPADLHDLLEEGFHLAEQRQPLQAAVDLPDKSPVISADLFLFPRVFAHLLHDLNCQEVHLKLERARLQVVGQHPRLQRDPSLMTLEGCRQLLELHGISLDREENQFQLTWEVPWKA